MKKLGYVPEIDTLRAFAVLLVVIYHAFPNAMPGGFIGVDVFFVASGYVISRSYLFQLASHEKTLKEFYIARFRRLAPALFFLLLVTTIAALILITPDRLIPYARSLLAQPFYVQNFVFWAEGDYFDRALTKPLLHTWSLAVEEQFYILWALGILFMRKSRAFALMLFALAVISSYGLGALLEGRSPKTVFYMLPTRIWEFGFGIAAFLVFNRAQNFMLPFANIIAVLMLAIIVCTGVFFTKSSTFPGLQALLACGASAAALLCFEWRSKTSLLLNFPPLLYIGKISYGLYLWHWPPLVLYYLATQKEAGLAEGIILIAIAFIGAVFSYRYVEQPIRKKHKIMTGRGILKMSLTGSVLTGLFAALILYSKGALFLYPENVRPFFEASQSLGPKRCSKLYVVKNSSAETCPVNQVSGPRKALLLGDSHADVLDEMIGNVGEQQGVPVYLTVRNCDLGRFGGSRFCSEAVLNKLVKETQKLGITDIFAISYFDKKLVTPESMLRDAQAFTNVGINLWIVQDVPSDKSYHPLDRARAALKGEALDLSGISREQYNQAFADEYRVQQSVKAAIPDKVRVLYTADYFCDEAMCRYAKNGVPYYLDTNHVTFAGQEVLRPMFEQAFEEMKNRP